MLQISSAPPLVERLAAAKPDLHELTTLLIHEPELIASLFDTIESPPSACGNSQPPNCCRP